MPLFVSDHSNHYGALASAVNLIAEREMADGRAVVWEYAAGTSWSPASRWQIGLEASGNLTKERHRLGPTLAFDPNGSTRVLLGANFGLNKQSDDRIRMIAEYGWF
ncbi:MAG: hypothetical protein HY321_00045 [Armatimonadetes bacterium]|nr:hypothetical protein [Armatimonadota bacterium]